MESLAIKFINTMCLRTIHLNVRRVFVHSDRKFSCVFLLYFK